MTRVLCGMAAIVAALAATATAQERIELFARIGQGIRVVEVDASVSGFGQIRHINPLPLPPPNLESRIYGPVALSGGRYMAWLAFRPGAGLTRNLVVFDRRTRQSHIESARLPALGFSGYAPLVADPDRPRLFVADATVLTHRVWVTDARTPGAPRVVFEEPGAIVDMAYAPASDRLILTRRFGASPGDEFTVVDVATGTVTHRIPTGIFGNVTTNRHGTRIWYTVNPFSQAVPRVFAIDVDSGAVAAQSDPMAVTDGMFLDEARGHIVAPWGREGRAAILDATSLALLGVVHIEPPPRYPSLLYGNARLLPGRWMTGGYVTRAHYRPDQTCNDIVVDALDPLGNVRATADVLRALGPGGSNTCDARGVLVRSPFAPEALSAQANGRRVTLAWRSPGDVTDFEVEAGLAPGRRDLTQQVGLTETAAFDGVPPGVYYVRVRAINEVGPSPASNEVTVVVR